MFVFLARKGVPSHLLKAIRAYYVGNTARLRVDNLLSTVINVTLGVLEGSCLSHFLFSTVFLVIWDFVTCSDFPSDSPRVLNLVEIWLIAFADDVVLLSVSVSRLQDAINKLFLQLKEFNLCMNLVKTELLTFLPPRARATLGTVQFCVNQVPLNQIEEFKYLRIFVSAKWGFSGHVARMRGRAEAASAELLRLVTTLEVRDLDRVTCFFKTLVESQWHGLELLPVKLVDEIEAIRAQFMKKMFDLPCSTATNMTLVIFNLWPANYESMSRRILFARKMETHDLSFVRDVFSFDKTLMRVKEGWHHESFLLFQSMFRSERASDFSIDRVEARLAPISRAKSEFIFRLLTATDEATVAPFRLFGSAQTLTSFRELLGSISKTSANLLLLFCSSGHQFRFFDYTALKCPLCSHSSWLTSHLFCSPLVEHLLARNGITWSDFEMGMRPGTWKAVLFLVHEVVTVWKNSFSTCVNEDAALCTLLDDAKRL
jgi:hypothetical protein